MCHFIVFSSVLSRIIPYFPRRAFTLHPFAPNAGTRRNRQPNILRFFEQSPFEGLPDLLDLVSRPLG